MSSKVLSAAVIGLNAEIIEVEADIGKGDLGMISIVGLPDTAVSESKERVRSAIRNSDLFLPKRKVTVNLAPADIKKHGPSYDLPIAVSLLLAANSFDCQVDLEKSLFIGELALSGKLRSINGVLPIAIEGAKKGIKTLFVSKENAREAKLAHGLEVVAVSNLAELVKHLENKEKIPSLDSLKFDFKNPPIISDMSHIKGQELAKRAMEIAAAGAHNMLMSGTPGSGKSLIAKTMPSILPNLILEEALEITKIYSVAGELPNNEALMTSRPFRSPHHTASGAALVGGGAWPRPGEISLAHRGVLFLDEFAEFPRPVLDNLRQPLEDGIINVSRAAGNLCFPAKFILVAAMNPCPCGYYGDKDKECICNPVQVINYKKKISGPILDRIDIHIDVPRIKFEKLSGEEISESSQTIKTRIEKAREIQKERFKDIHYITNSEMDAESIKKYCEINQDSKNLLKTAVDQMNLSARAYFRILKLSRTIADLMGVENIQTEHIAEALQYRPKVE